MAFYIEGGIHMGNLEKAAFDLAQKNNTQIGDLSQSKIDKNLLTNDSFPTYKAPLQPSRTEILATENNPNLFINNLWEPLRNANANYITRTLLGKDQSNTYDIWSYIFTPEKYEKTVIVGANVHGWEVVGQKVVYQVMKLICEQSKTHPVLNYLREKVRFVVIPIINPHGVTTGDRRNSRLVDINRNFDYRWSNYTSTDPTTAKGDSAASEKETQLISALIDKYAQEGATVHFDVHNTQAQPGIGYFFAIPNYTYGTKRTAIEVAKRLNPNATFNNQNNYHPMSGNYSSKKHGMHSLTIEWIPGGLGDIADSAEDITQGVNFFANAFYHYAILPPTNVYKLKSTSVISMHHSTSTLGVVNTAYEELVPYTYTFEPLVDGILEVDGRFTVHNSTAAGAISYITCAAIQSANDMINADFETPQKTYNEMYTEFNGMRGSLSVGTAVRVYASKGSNQIGPVTIKFYAKATAGTLNIRRGHIKFRFTPNDSRDGLVEYKAFNTETFTKSVPQDDY